MERWGVELANNTHFHAFFYPKKTENEDKIISGPNTEVNFFFSKSEV